MEIQSYLRAIRKSWWLIVLTVVLGAGGATAYTAQAEPQYASSVTFLVSTPAGDGLSVLAADQFATKRITTYVGLLSSDVTAAEIIKQTGLSLTVNQVKNKIEGEADLNTVLLTARVTDSSPDRALQIATAISKSFGSIVAAYDPIGPNQVEMRVVSGPSVSQFQVSPRPTLNLALGLGLGLALGIAAALLRQLLDNTVRSPQALRAISDIPVLGVIPYDRSSKKAPLIVDRKVRSIRAEALRQLRTNLQFIDVEKPVRVLVVTSSVAGEGKSATATNLAIAFADSGQRVLLIEGDLRRPRVADYLGLERAVGLTNVLAGQALIEDVLQPWGSSGLQVLPCGSIPPNPSELLGSVAMMDLLVRLKEQFDIIVIDTPPLLPVTDAAVAAVQADGAVMVVRHGRTTRTQIATAQRSLVAVDARILGSILNMSPIRGVDAYESHGYGYYEDRPKKPGKSAAAEDEDALELLFAADEPAADDVVDTDVVDTAEESEPEDENPSFFSAETRLPAASGDLSDQLERGSQIVGPATDGTSRHAEKPVSVGPAATPPAIQGGGRRVDDHLKKRSRRSKREDGVIVMKKIAGARRTRKRRARS